MKKLILIVLILSISGCVGNRDFTKVCTVKTNSKDITDKEILKVNFNNKDEITDVIITRTYTLKNDYPQTLESIKKSSIDYNNSLLTKKGIKISIVKDTKEEYVIKYYLNVPKMNEKDLEIFDLKKNSIKFFNKMRSKNVECK